MSWINPNTKTLRAYTEFSLDLMVARFIEDKESKGEYWEVETYQHKPARLMNYKPWIANLRRI